MCCTVVKEVKDAVNAYPEPEVDEMRSEREIILQLYVQEANRKEQLLLKQQL